LKKDRKSLSLYLVTDRGWVGDGSLSSQVEDAIIGGVSMVQVREKGASLDEFESVAREVKSVTDRFGVPLIINDSVEVALRVEADGVHVGQSDGDVGEIRRMIGAGMILGVSVATVDDALRAQAGGADYLGVGAVFATGTKGDAKPVELSTLRSICAETSIPVVAIGGIGKDTVPKLAGCGIDGIAVVSAILAQSDIVCSAASLRKLAESVIGS
jgi:thiamine-phosphate diphosphorylase